MNIQNFFYEYKRCENC